MVYFLYLCAQFVIMRKYVLAIAAFLLCLANNATAQNTSSPYSRLGYGELNDNVPGAYRALGGTTFGLRSNKVINPAQPASFSAVDSTSFMMDFAVAGLWSNYQDANGSMNTGNGNLEYITFQFPLWRWIGFSAGVTPYTSVNYTFAQTDSINAAYHYVKAFAGDGGISQVYAGLSFNILDWVAIGANVYYMFGQTNNSRTLSFVESGLNKISQLNSMRVSDVRFRYGLQFFHTWNEHSIVIGGVFENKTNFNIEYSSIETTTNDTVILSNEGFELPMMYGAGVSYSWANRLTVALDYSMTDLANALYFGNKQALQSRQKYALGVEYRHNPLGRKYWEHMLFRVGATLSDSYVKSMQAKEIGVSLGIGFPLPNINTVLNTTFEYGHRGTNSMLSENYIRFTFNASINENWFFKRKL